MHKTHDFTLVHITHLLCKISAGTDPEINQVWDGWLIQIAFKLVRAHIFMSIIIAALEFKVKPGL